MSEVVARFSALKCFAMLIGVMYFCIICITGSNNGGNVIDDFIHPGSAAAVVVDLVSIYFLAIYAAVVLRSVMGGGKAIEVSERGVKLYFPFRAKTVPICDIRSVDAGKYEISVSSLKRRLFGVGEQYAIFVPQIAINLEAGDACVFRTGLFSEKAEVIADRITKRLKELKSRAAPLAHD